MAIGNILTTTAINAAFPTVDFYFNMKEGNGVVKSAAKAGINFGVAELMTGVLGVGPTIGLALASTAGAITNGFIDYGRQNVANLNNKVSGTGHLGSGSYRDSEFTQTMRQRNLEQMGGHQGLARNALGSEGRRRSMMINY